MTKRELIEKYIRTMRDFIETEEIIEDLKKLECNTIVSQNEIVLQNEKEKK